MPRTTALAHRPRPPAIGLLITEPLRALLDFCAAKLVEEPVPVGDGHPVVVYPGLGGGALSTVHLRHFLRDCGFSVRDWGGGVNTGPDADLEAWLQELVGRVQGLHLEYGRKVSLVGWSLGGIYAREIAKRAPESVRQVITLGTPFGALGDANHAGTVFRLLGGDTSRLTRELQAQLRERPPVPTTSVYSKSDGVVSWHGCLQDEGECVQNVEVNASHLGMGTHPQVLRVVLDRLALPEGSWRPYRARRGPATPATARRRSVPSPAR